MICFKQTPVPTVWTSLGRERDPKRTRVAALKLQVRFCADCRWFPTVPVSQPHCWFAVVSIWLKQAVPGHNHSLFPPTRVFRNNRWFPAGGRNNNFHPAMWVCERMQPVFGVSECQPLQNPLWVAASTWPRRVAGNGKPAQLGHKRTHTVACSRACYALWCSKTKLLHPQQEEMLAALHKPKRWFFLSESSKYG